MESGTLGAPAVSSQSSVCVFAFPSLLWKSGFLGLEIRYNWVPTMFIEIERCRQNGPCHGQTWVHLFWNQGLGTAKSPHRSLTCTRALVGTGDNHLWGKNPCETALLSVHRNDSLLCSYNQITTLKLLSVQQNASLRLKADLNFAIQLKFVNFCGTVHESYILFYRSFLFSKFVPTVMFRFS